jgi:hypothetical protein
LALRTCRFDTTTKRYLDKAKAETVPMVGIALPDPSSLSFWAAVVLPIVLGFIVGLIIKRVLKLGIAIAALVIILILLGIVAPSQILGGVLSIVKSGSALTAEVQKIAGYLPYSSVTFIIGLAIGFFKG